MPRCRGFTFSFYKTRTITFYLNAKVDYTIDLTRKFTLPQLKKYDVTQKVIEALADAESRTILFSLIKQGRTAADIADKYKIPLSSVYKKLTDLEDLTLVHVERWMISDKGRKFKVYRSRISKADISIKKPEPVLVLAPN